MRGSYLHQYRDYEPTAAFEADKQMLSDAINGSKALLEALKTNRGPDRFMWREAAASLNKGNPSSANRAFMVQRVNLIQQREALTDSLRVSRDPCPVCATRTDIGCEHRRAG